MSTGGKELDLNPFTDGAKEKGMCPEQRKCLRVRRETQGVRWNAVLHCLVPKTTEHHWLKPRAESNDVIPNLSWKTAATFRHLNDRVELSLPGKEMGSPFPYSFH